MAVTGAVQAGDTMATNAIKPERTSRSVDPERRERLGAAAVYAAGAIIYFVLRRLLDLDFLASPLIFGVVLLAASYFRPRLLASGILLASWGVFVLLDGKGPFADGRSAPMYVLGFGVGALILLALRERIASRISLEAVATVMTVAGVWYYLVYDFDVLEAPWLWSAYLLGSAAALVATALMPDRT